MAAFDQWRRKSAMAARWPGAVLLFVGQQADGRGGDAWCGAETRDAEGTLCAERHRGEPKRQLRGDERRAVVFACDERRSEEHTSELQSLRHLVCRLLLEKKK